MQILNFNTSNGVDTKTNPFLVTDKFLQLDNAEVYNARIRKSPGYVKLGSTDITTGTFAQQVFTYDNNLYKVQDQYIYSYRKSTDSFYSLGTLKTLSVYYFSSVSNLTDPGIIQTVSACYGDLVCFVIFNTTTQYYQLFITDISQNQVLYSDLTFLSSSGAVFDVVGVPGAFVVYTTTDHSDTDVVVDESYIATATFKTTSYTGIITDLYYFPGFDSTTYAYAAGYYPSLTAQYSNGYIFINYRYGIETACYGNLVVRNLSGTTSRDLPEAFSAMDLTTYQGNCNFGTFSINSTSLPYVVFMVGYKFYVLNTGDATTHKTFQYTTPTAEIFQTFNIAYQESTNSLIMLKHNPIQSQTSGSQVCPFVNIYSLSTDSWTTYTNTCSSLYNAGQYYNVHGACSLAGGVVCLNDSIYFCIAIFSYLQSNSASSYYTPTSERRCTIYLVDSDYNVVQALLNLDATLYTVTDETDGPYSYIPCVPRVKVDVVSDSILGVTYPLYLNQKVIVNGSEVTLTANLELVTVTSSTPQDFFYADYNKSGYFGSSRLVEISASTVSEQNFFDYPQCEIVASNGSGSLTSSSSYAYCIIYEWSNGEGEVVRSASSIEKSVKLGSSDDTVTVYFTPYPFFTLKSSVRTKIYRTTADGNVLFLVTTITNNTTRSYVDTLADSSLQSEEIYTTGNVLSNFPFQASSGFVLHNGLVFSIRQSDPTILDFSMIDEYGVSLAWNPGLYLKGEPRGGAFVALASLDDKLIAFKQDYIYVVTGDGPDATGLNATFQGPSQVTSPVGCKYANTVVRTPLGIMFMSYKGIYLLDRSLSIDDVTGYIGADVEAYNDYIFTSASLSLRENKVKFTAYTVDSSDSYTGVVLVYDYYYKTWSVETDLFFVSATTYGGYYTALKYTGDVYQTNPAIYLRDGQTYSTVVQTPWAKLATLQSLVTVNEIVILGTYVGDHVFQVGIAYDYEDSDVEFMTFSPTDNLGASNSYGVGAYGNLYVYAGESSSVFQIRIDLRKTTCMTFRLTFWDKFTSSAYQTGNSFTLTNISVTYMPETEINSLLQTQIIGPV